MNKAFTVESHSNDDYDVERYVDTLEKRLKQAPPEGEDLFSVLCPTRDRDFDKDAGAILRGRPFSRFNEIHLLLLQYKWDLHAELRIADVQTYLSLPMVTCYVISAPPNNRGAQILALLQGMYP